MSDEKRKGELIDVTADIEYEPIRMREERRALLEKAFEAKDGALTPTVLPTGKGPK